MPFRQLHACPPLLPIFVIRAFRIRRSVNPESPRVNGSGTYRVHHAFMQFGDHHAVQTYDGLTHKNLPRRTIPLVFNTSHQPQPPPGREHSHTKEFRSTQVGNGQTSADLPAGNDAVHECTNFTLLMHSGVRRHGWNYAGTLWDRGKDRWETETRATLREKLPAGWSLRVTAFRPVDPGWPGFPASRCPA